MACQCEEYRNKRTEVPMVRIGQRPRNGTGFSSVGRAKASATSVANRCYAGSPGSVPAPIGSTRTREWILSIVTRAPCSRASRRK